MSTLQELVRYCTEENTHGALLLTGEIGCGKTHLVEKELAEALKDTHFLVRVSLLGIDSLSALQDALRRQWLLVCTPFLAKTSKRKDRAKKAGILSAIATALASVNPVAENVASVVTSINPLEYIPLEAEVEDFHEAGRKKRVVMVFDDLERNKVDLFEVMGYINDCCENKGFKTIIIANEQAILATSVEDTETSLLAYKIIKEKTVSRTLLYLSDYARIVHEIVTESKWPTQEYADFLLENEALIQEVFTSDLLKETGRLGKHHNIRSLNCALQEFGRVHELLSEKLIASIPPYFYSFIAYILATRSGIFRDGHTTFSFTTEELRELYPAYRDEHLPEWVRQWIEYGVWEEDSIAAFLQGSAEKE